MKERETTFNYLEFQAGEEKLLVATTRPELLYGCVCVFVNPEDKRYRRLAGKWQRCLFTALRFPF